MEIRGKTALVTGAVKGIGKGIGIALARLGAKLVLTRHDWEESFEQMEKDFSGTGADHKIIDADLRNIDEIKKIADFMENRYGHLDILINNIERGGWPTVHGKYTQEQWDLEIQTTINAKQWIFTTMLPLLEKAEQACVINISSIAGITGRSGPGALVFNDGYSAANRAISSFTETWARLGAPSIRVNELMLGIFDTRHARKTRGWNEALTKEEKQSLIDHTLLKRTGTVEDAVKACLFMIKDAPYMTGSVLRLDGGYVLAGEKIPPMPKGIL
jgi:3-oxoacyl-[acyl-carrier protein] reductase